MVSSHVVITTTVLRKR